MWIWIVESAWPYTHILQVAMTCPASLSISNTIPSYPVGSFIPLLWWYKQLSFAPGIQYQLDHHHQTLQVGCTLCCCIWSNSENWTKICFQNIYCTVWSLYVIAVGNTLQGSGSGVSIVHSTSVVLARQMMPTPTATSLWFLNLWLAPLARFVQLTRSLLITDT